MVDPDRLHRVLQRVRADLARLAVYRERNDDWLADDEAVGNVSYRFVTAIEGAVDAAHHVCASEDLGAPDSNAQAFELLARAGLLDSDLADRLGDASRFRNVLVHGYARVELDRVAASLDRLDDLGEFCDAMDALL